MTTISPAPMRMCASTCAACPRPSPKVQKLTHYRIDRDHSNSYAAWLKMGSPIAPSTAQRATMLKAAELATMEDAPATIPAGRKATLSFKLPRQGVSLIVLTAGN